MDLSGESWCEGPLPKAIGHGGTVCSPWWQMDREGMVKPDAVGGEEQQWSGLLGLPGKGLGIFRN